MLFREFTNEIETDKDAFETITILFNQTRPKNDKLKVTKFVFSDKNIISYAHSCYNEWKKSLT